MPKSIIPVDSLTGNVGVVIEKLGDEVTEEKAGPLLMVESARLLFPFARNILADATREGGFPPLMLAPVDFAALYEQQKNQTGE